MHKCSLHDENLYRLVSKLRNHSEYAFYQYTMIGTIATGIRQGWEHKCEVVGQGSFVLPNACCLSTVICVLEHCHLRMWQATATVTRTSLAAASHLCLHMCWLWVYLRCGVDQVICWTLSWDVCLVANKLCWAGILRHQRTLYLSCCQGHIICQKPTWAGAKRVISGWSSATGGGAAGVMYPVKVIREGLHEAADASILKGALQAQWGRSCERTKSDSTFHWQLCRVISSWFGIVFFLLRVYSCKAYRAYICTLKIPLVRSTASD